MTKGRNIKDMPPLTKEEKELYRARYKQSLFRQLRSLFRRLQREQGMTQKDLARRLGADEALISKRLRGEANMTVDTLCDLARAMEARLEPLIRPLAEIRESQQLWTTSYVFVVETKRAVVRTPPVIYSSNKRPEMSPAVDTESPAPSFKEPGRNNSVRLGSHRTPLFQGFVQ